MISLRTFAYLLFSSLQVVYSAVDTEEKLIGWKGDTYKPQDPQQQPWVEVISWTPRSMIFHNFITEQEARHIVDIAWPQMQRSTVVGPNGESVFDDYRTSYGTFLNRLVQRSPQRLWAV